MLLPKQQGPPKPITPTVSFQYEQQNNVEKQRHYDPTQPPLYAPPNAPPSPYPNVVEHGSFDSGDGSMASRHAAAAVHPYDEYHYNYNYHHPYHLHWQDEARPPWYAQPQPPPERRSKTFLRKKFSWKNFPEVRMVLYWMFYEARCHAHDAQTQY
jgi:hypothetical protein